MGERETKKKKVGRGGRGGVRKEEGKEGGKQEK